MAENDRYYIREPRQLQRSQPPEILFVERCVRLLEAGHGSNGYRAAGRDLWDLPG